MAEYHGMQRTTRQRRPPDWLAIILWAALFACYVAAAVIALVWL